jgi:hypothetical protein
MNGEPITHRFDFVNVVIESQKSNKKQVANSRNASSVGALV